MHPCNFRGTREMSTIFFTPFVSTDRRWETKQEYRSDQHVSWYFNIIKNTNFSQSNAFFYWLHRRSNVRWYQFATWSAPMIWLMWPPNLCTLFLTSIVFAMIFQPFFRWQSFFFFSFNCFWIFSLFLLVFSAFFLSCLFFFLILHFFHFGILFSINSWHFFHSLLKLMQENMALSKTIRVVQLLWCSMSDEMHRTCKWTLISIDCYKITTVQWEITMHYVTLYVVLSAWLVNIDSFIYFSSFTHTKSKRILLLEK